MEQIDFLRTFLKLKIYFESENSGFVHISLDSEAFSHRKDLKVIYGAYKQIEEDIEDKENNKDIVSYLLANFIAVPNFALPFILTHPTSCKKNFLDWKKRNSDFDKLYTSDLKNIALEYETWENFLKVKNKYDFPKCFKLLQSKKITPETFCCLDYIFNFRVFYKTKQKLTDDNLFFESLIRYFKYTKIIKFDSEHILSITPKILKNILDT